MFKKHIILSVSFFFFSLIHHIHAIMYTPELVEEISLWFDQEKYIKHYPCDENPIINWLNQEKGTTDESYGEELIVSMTSHPPRIGTTYLAIESLLRQSIKPNHMILNLALEDFPGAIDDPKIPQSLKILQERGLEIRFSDINYRVATKLIPTYIAFPQATIITADDDRIYHPDLIKSLWEQHQKYSSNIISSSARQYIVEMDDTYIPINYLPNDLDNTLLFEQEGFGIFEGFAGVLYPANALHSEIVNVENFKLLTPCADDVWYQMMALLQGTKVRGLSPALNQQLRNPLEIDGTQASGLFHEHLNANSVMVYNALRFYQLLEQAGIPYVEAPICKACRRIIVSPKIAEASSSSEISEIKKSKKCKTCFNDNRKKILCVGAYDYGNIGDGSYKIILEKLLSERLPDYEIHFVPDTARINQKGKYIGFRSDEEDLEFDYLILGGGGILKEFAKKDNSMYYYARKAIDKSKPFFFLSVGLQTSIQEPDGKQVKKLLGDSKELLEKASLIFVRSVEDYSLLSQAVGKAIKHKIFQYPDLGYCMPYVFAPIDEPVKKYVTLIQTGSATINNEYVVEEINTQLALHEDAILVVMNWGGMTDPRVQKDFGEWDLFDYETIRAKFLSAKKIKVYMGNTISENLKNFRYAHHNVRQSDLTPEKAMKIVQKSHHVFTGRFHGRVFAEAYHIPWEAPCFTYKLIAENRSNYIVPTQLALRQIDILCNFLMHDKERPKAPNLWEDGDRNTAIVYINNQVPKLRIRHLQAMNNTLLWQSLVFGNTIH